MKILLIFSVLALAAVFAVKHLAGQPPLRGMVMYASPALPALASRARPEIILIPDAGMQLRGAGWRSLSPRTRKSIDGDARLWFACYQQGEGRLVTALAEAENQWQWEAAHHPPFPVLRQLQYDYKGQTLYESLYVLPVAEDPFAQGLPEDSHVLIYRAKFLLFFRKMQIIVEYREALPDQQGPVQDIAFETARLNAFQTRARTTWQAVFPDRQEMAALASDMQKLDTAPSQFSRRKLSRWVGEMHWHDDL
ncbi:MAG: DUF4851 domain-containing protein [Desulfovibrio sp.]|nr:DUF4851 domain-containing protein [Desulfovibrio sp.]